MATRSKRFITGILSGYGSIAASILCTMVSVPLALHYLDKQHFGLWALATQISAYLALIDLGISNAISRFLADHKDDVQGGEYGNYLITGTVVFLFQGLFIAAVGIALAPFTPAMFAIPPAMAGEFRTLLIILTCSTGFSVAMRSLGAPLWPFQRNDVFYACATFAQFVGLGLLWLGFHLGWGVISFPLSQIPLTLGSLAVYAWVCHRNHYFPSLRNLGRPSMRVFRKLFDFGKDNLMVVLGSQLVNATQIIIISRWVGLEAAATYSVATKFYGMAMQLAATPVSASSPGLTELWVRGERQKFSNRFWDLISLVIIISTVAAAGLTTGNKAMILIWTHQEVNWTCLGDLLLGLMIVIRNVNGCFVGLFGLVGNWAPVRLILFMEGLVFVALAILLRGRFGIHGVLVASLAAHLGVTSVLSARAAKPIIGGISRLKKPLLTAITMTLFWFLVTFLIGRMTSNAYVSLGVAFLAGIVTTFMMWKLAMPTLLKEQMLAKLKELAVGMRLVKG